MKNVKNSKKQSRGSSDKHHRNNKHKRKQANKEWFDEKCARMNEKKNARRQKASHPKQQQRSQECLQTSPCEREAFGQKKERQLDEEASIEIGVFRALVNFTST
jgi:hypothetical protein